ncbi:glycosyltransferase [Curtobacterium sp. C1]|uniref:glycosyltransferase n=1 Tax=Curtobacterium sp. C1 TaxID=2898151 RepID=UPI001E401E2B|nr:glycosyltransferase [Curtobacterium sp. C1]UFU14569.1 glycosyltransferase [Curtobacterium sp. C1]
MRDILVDGADDVEMIVIDGAVRESTQTLAEAMPGRVRLIAEPDDGIYDAMNKGLAAASGEYVWFLNGGDEAVISWRNLASLIGRHETSVLLGDYVLAGRRFDVARRSRAPGSIWHALPTSHQAILYPRGEIGALMYESRFGIVGDYAFTARLYVRGIPFARAFSPLARFHLDGVSSSQAVLIGKQAGVVQREILGVSRVRRYASAARHQLSRQLRRMISGEGR